MPYLRNIAQDPQYVSHSLTWSPYLVRNSFQTNMELKAESVCSCWDMLACTVRQRGHV